MNPHSDFRPTPYEQIRKNFRENSVRHTEVPVEHSISLPLPTLRWSVPSFTGFAGPAVRAPGRPLRLAPPDRWWALDRSGRRLIGYALTSVVPFAEASITGDVSVDQADRTIAELQEDLRLLDELMDQAIGPFFASASAATTVGSDLREALISAATTAVVPWYRQLAPDFFAWVEEATR
jgi:hypothetical protein